MRFAGTAKQYSTNAMPQLTITTSQSGLSVNFRCPYQAKVMNTFEIRSSPMGSTLLAAPVICASSVSEGAARRCVRPDESGPCSASARNYPTGRDHRIETKPPTMRGSAALPSVDLGDEQLG